MELEALAGYSGYDFESDWSTYKQQILEESIRAQYSAWIVERSMASYYVGLTLGRTDDITDYGRDTTYSFDYDAGIDFWEGGLLPISLYAQRQTRNLAHEAVPSDSVTSQTFGFNADLVPQDLPRVHTRGYLSETYSESLGEQSYMRQWDLSGDVSRYTGRLNAKASVDRYGVAGDASSLERMVDTIRMYADYRLFDDMTAVARGWSRRYVTNSGGTPLVVESQESDSLIRWTPGDDLVGTVFTQFDKTAYDGMSTGESLIGASFGRPNNNKLSTLLSAGYETSSYDDGDGIREFSGEYLTGELRRRYEGRSWGYLLESQLGSAYYTQIDVGSGPQLGAEARFLLSRYLLKRLFRFQGGGTYGQQYDESPLDLDYRRYGWEAGLESRQMAGLSIYLRADESVIQQLSIDEGNSDRFNLNGVARYAISRNLSMSYVINMNRQILDDDYSASTGQSFQTTLRLGQTNLLNFNIHRYLYENDTTDPWHWTRFELQARHVQGSSDLQLRAAIDFNTGAIDESETRFIWFEYRRRWQWSM